MFSPMGNGGFSNQNKANFTVNGSNRIGLYLPLLLLEYLGLCSKVLYEGLQKSIEDPYFNLMEPGKTSGLLAKELLDIVDQNSLKPFALQLAEQFFSIITFNKVTSADREFLSAKFYNSCVEESLFGICSTTF